MKHFFTSDTHFNDPRLKIYSRPFTSVDMANKVMIANWNSVISPEDTVWHLGDFSYDEDGYSFVNQLNGKINLILGNYDYKNLKDYSIFNSVKDHTVLNINGKDYFLTHKPEDGSSNMFNIVGHIHGLWRVQRNMLNVGVDANHFLPLPTEKIEFQVNGILKHYDINVFAGELPCNKITIA